MQTVLRYYLSFDLLLNHYHYCYIDYVKYVIIFAQETRRDNLSERDRVENLFILFWFPLEKIVKTWDGVNSIPFACPNSKDADPDLACDE